MSWGGRLQLAFAAAASAGLGCLAPPLATSQCAHTANPSQKNPKKLCCALKVASLRREAIETGHAARLIELGLRARAWRSARGRSRGSNVIAGRVPAQRGCLAAPPGYNVRDLLSTEKSFRFSVFRALPSCRVAEQKPASWPRCMHGACSGLPTMYTGGIGWFYSTRAQ